VSTSTGTTAAPTTGAAPETHPVLKAAALGAGVGLAAWLLGEAVERTVVAPIVSEFVVSGNQQFALREGTIARKALLTFAGLGGLLGLTLGARAAWSRRDRVRLAVAGLLGLVLGAGAGGGAGYGLSRWFVRNERPMSDDLILPLLTHGGIAAAVGLAAGLSAAVGLGATPARLARLGIAGIAGGALAAAVSEPAGVFLFPLDQTGQPLAAGAGARLLALALPAVSVAVLVGLAAREEKPTATATAAPAGQPAA